MVARGRQAGDVPFDFKQGESLRRKTERFWETATLPYDRLEIPDSGVQALLDSSIRNIYQAREIKKDLPAFQVGPTCYRGLWVVDGSFLLEAITYLGRANETRDGVKYLMSFQRKDGSFMLMDAHWKETGIALWAITRHARLTGDKDWLRPGLAECAARIRLHSSACARCRPPAHRTRGSSRMASATVDWRRKCPNTRTSTGPWPACALPSKPPAGSGRPRRRRTGRRNMTTSSKPSAAPPSVMPAPTRTAIATCPSGCRPDEKLPPQKAQWAFLHALFPGKVFPADDPLVRGNMAMLKAVEKEGLVQDTGWLKDGIWTYFGSFYGHAWLWLGEGDKAARTLYAFGNHASPLLAWREEQMPVGQGEQIVGDMPHNWASAEFIRLVRHSLILERGNELHLFEGMPAKWASPGAVTRARDIATEFGPMSLEFRVARNGTSGILKLTPPQRDAANPYRPAPGQLVRADAARWSCRQEAGAGLKSD